MANYSFKINIQKGNGSQLSFYTSSFANSGQTQVSASTIVNRITSMPKADTYIQSEEAATTSSGVIYSNSFQGSHFLNVSTNESNTGSIIFTDTETTLDGGLDFYTFWGTKVCSTLGLPEGIPIYTENFRLSDNSSNPDNYLSGDVIADSVSIKNGFKMSPQGRMRSNLVWDDVFGEGLLQWISGSTSKLAIGYDDVSDAYKISANSSAAPHGVTFNITGVDQLTGANASITNLNVLRLGTSSDLHLLSGQSTVSSGFNATDFSSGQIQLDSGGLNQATGVFRLEYDSNDLYEDVDGMTFRGAHDGNGNNWYEYGLTIANRHDDEAGVFAGICFVAGTEDDNNSLGASIAAVRDISADGTSTLHDTNLHFATNDGGDNGLKERMVIFHDGEVRAKSTVSASLFRSSGDVVAFYTSDERLKDNVKTISEPIYKLQQLRGVEYEWNDKQDIYPSGSKDSGIIAQDVEKVLPQLVKENSNGYLGVRHDRLVGLLIESVKDQQKQIDDLKREVKELKDG